MPGFARNAHRRGERGMRGVDVQFEGGGDRAVGGRLRFGAGCRPDG